jgi:peptidoglycan/xylan/chitin deacetylase (PgdA/CDA1 family)
LLLRKTEALAINMNRTRFGVPTRWLTLAFFVFALASPTPAQQRVEVAITVDDLPAHGDMPSGVTRAKIAQSMTETFKAKGVPSVYGFVNAKRPEGDEVREEVLKVWTDAGFPLGNHTYSHVDLNAATPQEFEAEIASNEAILQQFDGARDWHWFRYPFLHEGNTLEKRHAIRKYLQEHGYKVAQVTLDFGDYAWNNPYARCMAKQDNQAIAWLKFTYLNTAANDIALDRKLSALLFGRDIKYVLLLHIGAFDRVMLPDLLDLFKKQGFDFISLDEAEKDTAYQSDPDAPLKYGGTLLEQLIESKPLKYPPHPDRPIAKLDAICR